MSDKNVNEDIKDSARNIENSDEAAEVVIEMEKKSLKLINAVSYGLSTINATYLKSTINL